MAINNLSFFIASMTLHKIFIASMTLHKIPLSPPSPY
jgi:hypothetical protein